MLKPVIYVAIGSAFGGVCRFLMQQYVQKRFFSTFPYGTLCVNLLGCFIIGVIYGLAAKGNILSQNARIFLATGICGGFTTYSSFMYENYTLVSGGEYWHTFLYIALSLLAGFALTALGIFCIKLI
jgi:CrcB protein